MVRYINSCTKVSVTYVLLGMEKPHSETSPKRHTYCPTITDVDRGLQTHHVETPFFVLSPRLSNAEPGQ